MELGEGGRQKLVITFFPMAIAALSLITSIYNGYLNNRFVDLIENNVGRLEYMRTCKEIIDAYFHVKAKAAALSAQGHEWRRNNGSAGPLRDPIGVGEAVARFGALGTYLANLRDESIRVRYTRLTSALETVVAKAPGVAPADLPRLLEDADRDFGALNDDCVRSAKAQRL